MIKGFEDLDSTKMGRIAESIIKWWLNSMKGFAILNDSCSEYDTAKDLIVRKDGKEYYIEVKGDSYPKGNNIALEHKQEGLDREMKPSGLSTTKSEYIFYYVFRWDRLYIFKKEQYNKYLAEGWINASNSKICNNKSKTGKTECYILDATLLEQDSFFLKVVDDVTASLDNDVVSDILGG